MDRFSFAHLTDAPLLDGTRCLQANDRLNTALLVARLAEIDLRQLCEREGHPSTFAWCLVELHMSEDEASRRIRAARFGRRYPELFAALADGRLHLTAVNLIGPHLTSATAEDWIAAAAHRTRAEIQALIALRRPRPDGPDGVVELADRVLDQVHDRVLPTAPQRYLLQCAGGESLRGQLQEARELMSHQNPEGRYEPVLQEALALLIVALRKQKFAASGTRGADRYVPSHVKEQVWERDGGACAYVGSSGRRCGSRWQVEFDHIDGVARGGEATVDGMRCLCRAHNQLEAERLYGAGFMEEQRRAAQEARRAYRIERRSRTGAGAGEPRTNGQEITGAGADAQPEIVTRPGAGSPAFASERGASATIAAA